MQEGREISGEDRITEAAKINLVSMKAVCVGGYIPADLTGHYFCNKMPCYYARDSIMVARAFFLSGHFRECRAILSFHMQITLTSVFVKFLFQHCIIVCKYQTPTQFQCFSWLQNVLSSLYISKTTACL